MEEKILKQASLGDIGKVVGVPLSAREAWKAREVAWENIGRTGNRWGIRHAPTTVQVAKDAKDTVLIELGKISKDPSAISEASGAMYRQFDEAGGVKGILNKLSPKMKDELREKLLTGLALGAGTTGAGMYLVGKHSEPKVVIKEASVLNKVLDTATDVLKSKKETYVNAWRNGSKIKSDYAVKGALGGAAVGAGVGYVQTGDAKGALAGAAAGAAGGYGGGHLMGSKAVSKVRGESLKALAGVGAVGAATLGASKVLASKGAKDYAARKGIGSLDAVIQKNDQVRNWFKSTKDDIMNSFKNDGVEAAVETGKAAVGKVQKNMAERGMQTTYASKNKWNPFRRKNLTKYDPNTGEGYQEIVTKRRNKVTGKKETGIVTRPTVLTNGSAIPSGPETFRKTSALIRSMMKSAGFIGAVERMGESDTVEKTAGVVKFIKNVVGSTVNPNYMVAPTAIKGAVGGAAAGGVIGGASGGADGAWKGALGGAALGGAGGAYMGKTIGQGYSTFGRTLAGTAGLFGGAKGLDTAVNYITKTPNFIGKTLGGAVRKFTRGFEQEGFAGGVNALKNHAKRTYSSVQQNSTKVDIDSVTNLKKMKPSKGYSKGSGSYIDD